MQCCKVRDIESSLSKKGFEGQGGSKHCIYIFYFNGKKTQIKTIISRSMSEYSSSNMGKIKNQLQLTVQQLTNLIKCPLKKEELIDIYREKKII